MLGGVLYLRLCDNPPVNAKVLSPVRGAREAGALLLRRAPLFLYAPHRAALAPLAGELDAQGSSIVLTGPADMSEALGELALMLNPSEVTPDAPTGPLAKDPPADDNVVNVTGPKSFPTKQSRQSHKLILPPKVVLNPQSSVDLSVKAVRVASDSDQDTYHLILNDVYSGSVTRSGSEGELRTLGGVIDLSSDEGELSV
ncbi:uncharacterized protein [Choristoneura fumiferana]|uniref:uncharacterized protein n=1 Tax=Choristoneura fumiferana TaxID=7141 RepID=UPI003D15E04E